MAVFLSSIALFCCLVLLSTSLEPCVYQSKYYISGSGQDSEKCLKSEQPHHPCANVTFLMDHVQSCATFEIMDDLTLVNTLLRFDSSFVNISLVGASHSSGGVTIECQGSSGIFFNSSFSFHLELLNFKNCTYNVLPLVSSSYHSLYPTTVLVQNCTDICITNCSFQNNIGSAILLVDVLGNIRIEHSYFRGSQSQLSSHVSSRKGGIVLRASLTSNWTGPISFTSCHFDSNHNADVSTCSDLDIKQCHHHNKCGGAIDILRADENMYFHMSILIKDCVFTDNQASAGGAISIAAGGNTHVSLISSEFFGNKGFCMGGAVAFIFDGCHRKLKDTKFTATGSELQDKGLTILGSKFEGNCAYWGGGLAAASILCDSCNLTTVTTVNITSTYWANNTAWHAGFAIGIRGPIVYTGLNCTSQTISAWLNDCSFDQNYKTGDSFGAVSAEKAYLTFVSSQVNFTSNNGTALTLTDTTADFKCSVRFENNYGILGGAIYMDGESYLNIDCSLTVEFF